MSEGTGEPNAHRKESVATANVPSDSPVTDPGQVRGGAPESSAAKFDGQRGKSGALKKSARYRSRSLSASSADSYSSTSYTGELLFFFFISLMTTNYLFPTYSYHYRCVVNVLY